MLWRWEYECITVGTWVKKVLSKCRMNNASELRCMSTGRVEICQVASLTGNSKPNINKPSKRLPPNPATPPWAVLLVTWAFTDKREAASQRTRTLCLPSHWLLKIILWGWHSYPHITNEKPVVQRGSDFQGFPSLKQQLSWNSSFLSLQWMGDYNTCGVPLEHLNTPLHFYKLPRFQRPQEVNILR